MFGYVTVNKPEMKVKDFERYHAFYCGLCHELKRLYGPAGQATLTYDMTFLVILLTGLYEPETEMGTCRCVVHPVGKHPIAVNKYSTYCAEMNLLLAYYNCLDKWNDERQLGGLLASKVIQCKCRSVENRYPRQAQAIKTSLERLAEIEKGREASIDEAARCTGELLAEIFVCHEDMWAERIRKMGFYLGKFIYLCDAWEDVDKDAEKGLYNPFSSLRGRDDFDESCLAVLKSMMAECALQFEALPIVEEVDILRNILYSGVWVRFGAVQKEKRQKERVHE
ncbi:MAG: hypothetical protein IJZ85_01885 [Lachnospiraceae bacterium]|nr:hypothetical protein [Lachnospiraceae bacterium]